MEVSGPLPKLQEWAALYGIRIVAAAAIFILGRWVSKAVTNIVKRMLTKNEVDQTLIGFVANLTYIALLAFVIIAALNQLGIQTTSFIAILGAAGLAIGLALQGSLANFAAGFLMIVFRPFKAGDFVTASGATGKIEKITIFNTIMNSPDNQRIIVPNGSITSNLITNATANETRRVDLVPDEARAQHPDPHHRCDRDDRDE